MRPYSTNIDDFYMVVFGIEKTLLNIMQYYSILFNIIQYFPKFCSDVNLKYKLCIHISYCMNEYVFIFLKIILGLLVF